MMEIDPGTLLEWLQVPGDMQVCALEQLSMMLLLASNVDHIFERYVCTKSNNSVLECALLCCASRRGEGRRRRAKRAGERNRKWWK